MPVIARRELWLFIAVVVLWGVNWPMMKMALAELNFWVFRSYCVLAGLAWFLGYNLLAGVSLKVPREHWARLAICALCNVAGWNILSAAGLNMLPSGRAGILAHAPSREYPGLSQPALIRLWSCACWRFHSMPAAIAG